MSSSSGFFTFPPGPAYNGTRYGILFTENVVELFNNCFLDLPFSGLNFLLIFKTSILHPNLKFILLSESACIFVRAIARIILIVGRLLNADMLTSGPSWLIVFYIQPTFIRNFIIHVMVIERIIATWFFRTYEHWRGYTFSICWLIFVSIISLLNALSSAILGQEKTLQFSFGLYNFLIVSGILEIIAFLWIWKYNERIYANKMAVGASRGLSERYQLSENVRTAKQMIPCIILHFINILYGVIAVYARTYSWISNQFIYDCVFSEGIFVLTSFLSFLIEISMLIFHPVLKREFIRFWYSIGCFFRRHHRPTDGIPNTNGNGTMTIASTSNTNAQSHGGITEQQKKATHSIVNLRGETLVHGKDEMVEHHFQHLNNAWQTGGGTNTRMETAHRNRRI